MVAEKALEAAKLGDLDLLESLNLSRCLNEQVADGVGATCVHYAARAGNLEVLEYLVTQCGFRGNKRSKIGATAAHDAAATGNLECLSFMLDFLKTGCQVDDTDSTGATILHLSSRFGHYSVVRWILENTECNATQKTAVGALPLHFAAARGDIRIVQLLTRQAPSTVNMQMNNGVTSAYLACQEGHLDVLKFLVLQAGASIKIPAHDGMMCIHSAAQSGNIQIVSYLVNDQYSDPNERDCEGTTPIHFAASKGHTKLLTWLLLNGGKILLDNLGGSPLHDAAEHGQMESITILLEHGCDPSLADNNGLTAEELAEHCLHRECAILIRQFRPSEPNGHLYNATNQNNGNGYTTGGMNGQNGMNGINGGMNGTDNGMNGINGGMNGINNGMNGHDGMNGHSRMNNTNGRMDFDDGLNSDLRSTQSSRKGHSDRRIQDHEPGSCVPTTLIVEVEVHRTNTGVAPAKRQCFSAETGETVNYQQMSQPTRPVSYPPSTILSDTHSDISSTTSSLSTLSYPDHRVEHENNMQRSHSDHHQRNSYHQKEENYGPQSPSQLAPPSNQRNRSVLGRFPQNQENGESGYGAHWSEQRDQMAYNQPAPAVGLAPSAGPPVQNSSTFEDQIRRQSLRVQSKSVASGYSDQTDSAHVPPPPPPMPPPTPPSLAPPAPPVPAVGSVKENVAKLAQAQTSKPYQFSDSHKSTPNKLNSSMQSPFKQRPDSLLKEKKSKTDSIIEELKSVNMVASLRKVQKDSAVVFDSSRKKTPTSPGTLPGSPVISGNVPLTPDMPFESFLEQVSDKDQRGNEVPAWRKQLLARQMMEKAKKEYEQRQKIEEEENRLKNMPQWKRDMLQRKKVETGENSPASPAEVDGASETKSVPVTPTVDDDGKPIPPWKQEFMQRRKSKSLEPLNSM
ncbi:espin-like isoform X4 [Lineus longissimus]|uniref:espin-like isoform X4 n=1 Tax=Lineus longissimus TaxID=88925 RepID=UPI00315C9D4F